MSCYDSRQGQEYFPLRLRVHEGPEAQPASYAMDTGCPSFIDKAAERDFDCLPPSIKLRTRGDVCPHLL